MWITLLSCYAKKGGLDKCAIITALDSIESNFADQTINAMFSLMKKSPLETLTVSEAIEMLEVYIRQPLKDQRGETIIGLPCCFLCKVPFKFFQHDIQRITHLAICAHRQLDTIEMLCNYH